MQMQIKNKNEKFFNFNFDALWFNSESLLQIKNEKDIDKFLSSIIICICMDIMMYVHGITPFPYKSQLGGCVWHPRLLASCGQMLWLILNIKTAY